MDRSTDCRISRQLKDATSALIALAQALDDHDWPAVMQYAGQLKLTTSCLNGNVNDMLERITYARQHPLSQRHARSD